MVGIPLELLDDLCTRFLLNVPAHELDSAEKAMFVVEQAHWYYEDFCRDADPGLPSLSLRVFAHALAAHCPDAFAAAFGRAGGGGQAQQGRQHQQQQTALIHDIDAAMAQFNAFKAQVPTAGAALLDPTLTKVLMVKGYKKDASWGFPRGKLSKGETAAECAAREVLEETGIDVSIDAASCPRIEVSVNGQATTLFVVAGAASEETPVAALVRGEIGDIAWHLLADLPATKDAGMLTYRTAAGVKHRFWRVWPYIKPLRRWVKSQQKGGGGGGSAGGGSARGGERAAADTPAKDKKRQKKSKSSGALDSTAAAAGPSTSKLATSSASPGKKGKDGARQQQQRERQRGPRRAPAPAAAAEHLAAEVAPEPGASWLNFSFDRARILAALRG